MLLRKYAKLLPRTRALFLVLAFAALWLPRVKGAHKRAPNFRDGLLERCYHVGLGVGKRLASVLGHAHQQRVRARKVVELCSPK